MAASQDEGRTLPRTFAYEAELPRVPLPSLADSCSRFLEWCAPLLTANELARTEKAVSAFLRQGGLAHKLQDALTRYNETGGVDSWLDSFWATRYLGRRDRIALNANFFFLFEDSGQSQIERAAELVAAAVDYKLQLDHQRIPPIIRRRQPQSMIQTKFLFSTTRIPGVKQDTIRSAENEAVSARHIVIFLRNKMFRLEVLGTDGQSRSAADIALALRSLIESAPVWTEKDAAIGHLTTGARARWATTRQALIECHPGNADSLDVLETALFCLCLEDSVGKDTKAFCDQLLHGDSGNRWFDKSVSLIVFKDGTAGINIEHSGLDGTTILGFVDAILTHSPEKGLPESVSAASLTAIEPIEFVLDDYLRSEIRAAADSFAEHATNTASSLASFDDFGANEAKRLGVSPDAFVQMAYQLAYCRTKGSVGATYESIATRQFRNGRTEAMRVVSPEAVRFVTAMNEPNSNEDVRRAAFRAAAEKHVARAKECQEGRAPEQHLWALQLLHQRDNLESAGLEWENSERLNQEFLALYESPGWLIMRDDCLSTSSAPSEHIQYFGFGSTSDKCIGIAYVLLPERLRIYLSTPLPVANDMLSFANNLKQAVYELRDLLACGESN